MKEPGQTLASSEAMATLDPANVADIVAEAFRQSRESEEKKKRDKDTATKDQSKAGRDRREDARGMIRGPPPHRRTRGG